MGEHNGTAAAPSAEGTARALEEYLAAAEAGAAPSREEFLRRHPELADDLDACMEALRFIGRAAEGPRSVAAGVLEAQPPEPAPRRLGDFRLIREVGRGGMGVVYEAEQVSLGRRVALKVLPFAATMDPRQLQRFHNEARAAASLDHPHIVHVHAVGCERAVHFYAMQFIEGQTLAAMIANLRRAGGRPMLPGEQATTAHVPGRSAQASDTAPQAAASTERAPRDRAFFRRAAELGVQAAEALDHAHQLGVVHRDVKPANLLVDERGGLWVADFGLAHMQSDAKLTMTGDLVGTLRYMSPEQALAKRVVIDHRTDVYSLGATLYELLTLDPAFGGNDRQELLRQIAFEEPKPPRRLSKAIPAELETIVLKAMEKNPAERYATAKEMADDLRRFLADEPIRARPASLVRRVRKWTRRRRAAVRAAAALMLALLVLGGVVLWRELGQRAAAEHSAEAALDRAALLQQQEDWDNALAVLALADEQLTGHGLGALRQRVERSRRDVDMLRKLEHARLERPTGKTGFDHAGADRLYTAAFKGYDLEMTVLNQKEAAERVRASAICDRLIAALDDWAFDRDQLKPGDGGSLWAIADLADDDPWRQRLRAAASHQDRVSLEGLADEAGAVSQPASSLHLLGLALRRAGNPALAVRLLRQAQAARPADFWLNYQLAYMLEYAKSTEEKDAITNNAFVGDHLVKAPWDEWPAEPMEAVRFYQAAVALRPRSSLVYGELCGALHHAGRLTEAEAAYRRAIVLWPDVAWFYGNLVPVLANPAWHGDAAKLREAEAVARKAIALEPGDAGLHNSLGCTLKLQRRWAEAEAEYHKAIELDADLDTAHGNLADLLSARERWAEAEAEYRKVIASQPWIADVRCHLGDALFEQGRLNEAAQACREAIERDAVYAEPHGVLAQIRARRGDLNGAITELRDAIRLGMDSHDAYYYIASGAALGGCGAGDDAAKLTDAERAALRKQALDWLRAELDARRSTLDKEPAKSAPTLAQDMQEWLSDSDLNGVRGPDALAKLPEAERGGWRKLWADVADLQRRAAEKAPHPGAADQKP